MAKRRVCRARVQSSFGVPLFDELLGTGKARSCIGVIEVVFRDANWNVAKEMALLLNVLQDAHVGLVSCNPDPQAFYPNLCFPRADLAGSVSGLVQVRSRHLNHCPPLFSLCYATDERRGGR